MADPGSRTPAAAGRILLAGMFLVGGCVPGTPAPAVTPQETPGIFMAGYHPWWGGTGVDALPLDLLDQLFFFEIEAGRDGTLTDPHGWPEAWAGLVDRANRSGVQVALTLTMHDPEAFDEVFSDPERSARLVGDVATLVQGSPGVRGIHLDLEVFRPVPLQTRDGYTAFVAALARELRRLDP
ncbi:MAG TPA: hypothetical protein VLA43_11850, partial [Longimicrobiales bacterium]|nr:hypothetical protein [Longimicrobiales bacterium]